MSLLDVTNFDQLWIENESDPVVQPPMPESTLRGPQGSLPLLDCSPPPMPAHLRALTDRMLNIANVTNSIDEIFDDSVSSPLQTHLRTTHFLTGADVISLMEDAAREDAWAIFDDSECEERPTGNSSEAQTPQARPRNPFQDMLPMCSPEDFLETMQARLRRKQETMPTDQRLEMFISSEMANMEMLGHEEESLIPKEDPYATEE